MTNRFYQVLSSAIISCSLASKAFSAPLSGLVKIDGSSTVFPISEAVAEEFGAIEKSVRVTVGSSGTGAGFKKFCAGETDISDASRPIQKGEFELCKSKGIQVMELPIATDGIALIVHPSNKFVTQITIAELKKIWEPGSKVKLWSDVNTSWPNEKIALFGPDADHGTFDFFTEAVVGKSKSSRTDYSASTDYNVIVKGVSASKFGLGYVGHGYYMANKNKINALKIATDKEVVEATDANILNGKYPLARLLYIYVSVSHAKKPAVDAYVNYLFNHVGPLTKETGFLPLTTSQLQSSQKIYAEKVLYSPK